MYMYICIYEVKLLSRVRLFATPWTVDYQASLSMEFSRQEYWSGLPFPSLNVPGGKIRVLVLEFSGFFQIAFRAEAECWECSQG